MITENAVECLSELKEEEKEQIKTKIGEIGELLDFEKQTLELVGRWLWVTGETKPIKDKLKKAGFKYGHKKKAWHWCLQRDNKIRSRNYYKLDEIKEKYGNNKIIPK